ncbi:tetratricopeptide (TPR) repeat protein [Actinoplanes lutulentus]|uniref:Tetratricopeptide repeat protein n=1 Tax=Actinoplanes lutulentus TaxID=1287878 RepID=A0A327Z947_9ACTN|nr:FxSxx-COOH system tetratricopeptide repeat protein [Actinoplanes lutulentus]MBB2946641.1 tetratricopeptide (TPR) repeat protein [Actinoplanes lutulentus]RAK35535.1 tetratricopeptide repeat protein [Actinoplanes lutulentus]
MAIPMPGRDRVPDGPVRDFVTAMHEIYDAAGQPASRLIAKTTLALPSKDYQAVSHETVSGTLRGGAVPAWEKVRSILKVLTDGLPDDVELPDTELRMRALWTAARHRVQDPPVSASRRPPVTIALSSARLPAEAVPMAGFRPRPAPGFVGRATLIAAVHTALTSPDDVRLVLFGGVGAGKTQTILHYLDRHHGADRPLWWVPCTTADTARASLIELAAALGVDRHHRVDRTVRLVLEALQARRFPYLMIFDGLDDPDLLRLVPNGGHVVITTRDPAFGDDGSSVGMEVPDLEPADAELLLRTHDPDLPAWLIAEVIAAYGPSPLAMRQLVSWSRVAGRQVGVIGDADPAECLTTVPADGYGSSASLALLLALDRLDAASGQALRLLEALSCFAPIRISTKLLGRGANATASPGSVLAETPRGEVALNLAILELRRRGLARLTGDGVEVLPLVRMVVRGTLAGEEAARAYRRAHAMLAAVNPGRPDDQRSATDMYEGIAAHVDATGLVWSEDLKARETVCDQVRFRYLAGDYNVACDLGEQAYKAWRPGNDPSTDDHLLLRMSHEWANALRATGQYERAGELTRGAMSQLGVDPAYGEDHPYTLAMAGSRAADLRIAGDYRRALEVDEETYELCKARFGEDHPRTVMSLHNRGISLRLNGEFRQAEQTDREALARHREEFGDANWRTLLSMNALAEDLNGQGRHQDVLTELEPMLARVTSQEHTRMDRGLLLAQRALALAQRGIGRWTEALGLLESSYADCVRLFGEGHEYPLALRMSRANTLHLLNRTDEAVEELSQGITDYRRLFGHGNPLTVVAEINLANALRARGDHSLAIRIDGHGSETLIDRVGRDHPFSVAALVNLASDYALGEHPNRLVASRKAVEFALRAYTVLDHPHVIAAEANLAADLAAANLPLAAEKRLEVLRRLEARYGPEHPAARTVARGERVDCVLEPPLV